MRFRRFWRVSSLQTTTPQSRIYRNSWYPRSDSRRTIELIDARVSRVAEVKNIYLPTIPIEELVQFDGVGRFENLKYAVNPSPL